jgi:hypothetical protein
VINAIKFSIEEIEASDQYFEHARIVSRIVPPGLYIGSPYCASYSPQFIMSDVECSH